MLIPKFLIGQKTGQLDFGLVERLSKEVVWNHHSMTLHGNPRQAPSTHSHTIVELSWLLKSGHAWNVLNNTSLWGR